MFEAVTLRKLKGFSTASILPHAASSLSFPVGKIFQVGDKRRLVSVRKEGGTIGPEEAATADS